MARFRGQLFVCATGCCCGRTEDGFAPVPTETFHREWERRRLRNVVHLTIGGCLGPCALANVVLLLFDGQAQWFHSIDSEALALALYDHVERMLEADGCLPPPAALAPYHFTASAWQPRPDGQPVDDCAPWRAARGHACAAPASGVTADGRPSSGGPRGRGRWRARPRCPRKNGELVFEEPWQGRVFGMAVALHERGRFEWEEFRRALIAADRGGGSAPGGHSSTTRSGWRTFEELLAGKGLVTGAELEETTYQFEFGERDDVF